MTSKTSTIPIKTWGRHVALQMRNNPYITLLLVIQIGIMVWNAAIYPTQEQYDVERHLTAVASGGLRVGIRNFDPPLYYMATLPIIATGKLFDIEILQSLEFLIPLMKIYNILILSMFYLLWIYWILPHLLPEKIKQDIAATLLFALPGYEKLAVMIHADNLLTLLTTIFFGLWLYNKLSVQKWRGIIAYALLLALIMLTRPFAVVPAGIFTIIFLKMIIQKARDQQLDFRQLTTRLSLFLAIVFIPIASWWGIRYLKTGQFINIADPNYYERYAARRKETDFDYYLTYGISFYFKELLQTPNRNYDAGHANVPDRKQSLNNSLWTVTYSDFWGDHWLYFSGPQYIEGKLWPKRILFVYALPITVALTLGFIWGAASEGIAAMKNKWQITPLGAASTLVIMGFGLWVFWQTFIALEPGKNSGIKFIYNAYYIPFAIPVALAKTKSLSVQKTIKIISFLLYFLSLPVSIYWR